MLFIASLRLGSTLDRAWRNHGRVSGFVEGVAFRMNPRRYESAPLDVDAMRAVQGHESVEIAAIGIAPAPLAAFVLSDAMPEPEPDIESVLPPALTLDDVLARSRSQGGAKPRAARVSR